MVILKMTIDPRDILVINNIIYDFRKRLLVVHKENIRDIGRMKQEGEYMFSDDVVLQILVRAN